MSAFVEACRVSKIVSNVIDTEFGIEIRLEIGNVFMITLTFDHFRNIFLYVLHRLMVNFVSTVYFNGDFAKRHY